MSTHFDGATIEPQDIPRLASQQERVEAFMLSGRWVTLRELSRAVGGSEASVSARLRDLRKQRFGGWIVDRRRVEYGSLGGGLWEYRMRKPEPDVLQPYLFS